LLAVRTNQVLFIRCIGGLALVVLLSLALNSGFFIRKYNLYGNPIATAEDNYTNHELSAPAILSNILRNIGLHLGTPIRRLNDWLTYTIFRFVLGEELNNPKTTWSIQSFKVIFSMHEDAAGNFIHMLTILLAFASAFQWIPKYQPQTRFYVGSVFFAALLFYLLLRWQPWGSRLHTSLFALSAPIIVTVLNHYRKGASGYIALSVIMVMAIYSIPYALHNSTRSLISLKWLRKSRMELYFNNRPQLYESYKMAMDVIVKSGVKTIGLYIGNDDLEYPLWVLGHNSGIKFHHVGVTNESKILNTRTEMPKYVIATQNLDTWPEAKEYEVICSDQNISVLKIRRNNQDAQKEDDGTG
jgi:hypothetical protein